MSTSSMLVRLKTESLRSNFNGQNVLRYALNFIRFEASVQGG